MAKNNFVPPHKILENYADVLVNFALGGGKGIKKGETVYLIIPESAKPLLVSLERAIYKAGGNLILRYTPDNTNRFGLGRDFFELANQKQASYFPEKYIRGLVDEVDHVMVIISETDMHALEGIDSKKIQQHGLAYKPYMDWRSEKEYQGKLTWTVALFGTEAMAKEARLSLAVYWQQIIQACFLDSKNPISEWKKVERSIDQTKNKLNKLKIEKVNIIGPDVDLWITIGDKRQWLGGGGRNIPSFEIFTSPDWRGTEGWIRFNQPLHRNGMLIDGIELTFKKGKVAKAKAKKNERALKDMIATKNADKLGEFSMTDRRFSRITKFMAETLFDENIGGENGNTHVALGDSYYDCVVGDPSKLSKKYFDKLGFNDSSVHTDIISTSPRTVTAYLKDGTERIIYKNGEFTI
jgi:aminopeptidase